MMLIPKRLGKMVVVLLFALGAVFFVYQKSLPYPFINWDDSNYVTENSLIRSLDAASVQKIFSTPQYFMYTPLTTLAYALQYQWHGLNPAGYRLGNLLIHLANICLLCLLIFLLTQSAWVSVGAVLIFAIHPVQVESVVWISQTKTLLSTFFVLLSLIQYIRASQKTDAGRFEYSIALLFFVLACLCKYSVVMLPLILCAYHLCLNPKPGWLKKTVPFFCVSLLGILVTLVTVSGEIKRDFIAANGSNVFYTSLVIAARYLELTLLPLPDRQSLIYTLPVYSTWMHPHVILSMMVVAGFLAFVVYLWKKNKALFFWSVWPILFLSPVLHLVPIQNLMNDRYLYVALVGFYVSLGLMVQNRFGKRVLMLLFGFLTLVYTCLNLLRQETWASSEIMWKDVMKKNPPDHFSTHLASAPQHNLGSAYLRKGQVDLAIDRLEEALRIAPHPETYGNLGMAYAQKGRLDLAAKNLKIAIDLKPDQADFYNNLGLIRLKEKEHDQALELFQKALTLTANSAIHNNIASIKMIQEKWMEAESHYLKALDLDPDFSDALLNLGLFYHRRSENKKALDYLARWIRINPNHSQTPNIQRLVDSMRA